MIKRLFIYSLVFAFSPIVSYSNTIAEDAEIVMKESVGHQNFSIDSCFDSMTDEDRETLASQLDSLFQVLVEESQDLYRDLVLKCKNENIELENSKQAVELIKELPSGKRVLQACNDIFSSLRMPADDLNSENFSFDALLQKLDEIAHVWHACRHSKDVEYAYKDLEMREKELEFKKDLLSWQKEKTDRELAWKRERYAREILTHTK
ncbi:hypothetical protein [Chlamydia psittaci]|uniref:hypothetical protein n=1 Tax=Chlamydia psittaci TaxID=83554 RepID=UPI0002010EC3|nr:hypothetical protein [Chlamydia psittaci]AFS19771.1 hypothetical protein B595_0815 [Chlamydia psittaci 84/55]AFS22959.1 hypothetical protein B600_0812 [Chlamydia psittaci VS225]ADZ18969.1 conserved hypothetical protein [Chlamydia psittaci 6BC]AEB55717.1 conserved hypothetical protein [Chlamydia psittaci 6BC]AEG85739.1 conserved hypothetical protein [Chlamydia psittaci C19/98]